MLADKTVFVLPEKFYQELYDRAMDDQFQSVSPLAWDWILMLPSPLHDGDRRAVFVQYDGSAWYEGTPWVLVARS